MRSIGFEGQTWKKYEELRDRNKALHKKLCKMLKEMHRGDPSQGIGKPEPLKADLSGFWSRCLSQKDRLVYSFDKKSVHIFAIGGHYDDK